MKSWIRNHQLLAYFGITFSLMFGVIFGYIFLQPGEPMQPWSLVWFFSTFSPTISAVLVSWVIGGVPEVKRLLKGYTRWKVGFFWYLAAAFLFFGPLAIALIYGLLGNPVIGLRPGVTIPILLGQVFFILFSGPVAEEAGWRGFALPRLQAKFNSLVSSLILGVIWTCWHIPLYFLTGASQAGIPFPFYLALIVTVTIYFTWLYNNTRGSLIITILGHYAFNLTQTLITGSLSLMPTMLFYMIISPLLLLIVVAVVIYFGPKYLSKKPLEELPAPAR